MAKKVMATLNVETELKNNGVRLQVFNDTKLLGYLHVAKAKLEWTDKNGKKPDARCAWEDFINWIKSSHLVD